MGDDSVLKFDGSEDFMLGGIICFVFLFVFGCYVGIFLVVDILDCGYVFVVMYLGEYVLDEVEGGFVVLKFFSEGYVDDWICWGVIVVWVWGFFRVIDVFEVDFCFD